MLVTSCYNRCSVVFALIGSEFLRITVANNVQSKYETIIYCFKILHKISLCPRDDLVQYMTTSATASHCGYVRSICNKYMQMIQCTLIRAHIFTIYTRLQSYGCTIPFGQEKKIKEKRSIMYSIPFI